MKDKGRSMVKRYWDGKRVRGEVKTKQFTYNCNRQKDTEREIYYDANKQKLNSGGLREKA